MAKLLTKQEKLDLLKNKYDPEIEGVPNIHRSTEKFTSILQKDIDEGKYSKEELKRINRTRKYRVKETKQP